MNLKKKILNLKFQFVVNFAGHINHSEKKKTYGTHYLGLKNLVEIISSKKNTAKAITNPW